MYDPLYAVWMNIQEITKKEEHIYINPANDWLELRVGIKSYFEWYNTTCSHGSLDNMTPDEIYYLTHGTDELSVA
jgi:transposase InsO family protein